MDSPDLPFVSGPLRVILDAVSDGVMVLDNDRRVQFLNRAARALLDYKENEAIGCRCEDVLNSTDCENNCPLTRVQTRGDSVREFEMCYRGKGDRRLMAATTFELLRDEHGVVVGSVEVFRDLTEIRRLEDQLFGRSGMGGLVGRSAPMRDLYELIEQVGPAPTTVLITGEPGTGKELVARAIHAASDRADAPFVAVNCAALAECVLESEFFGHVRGAFSGAHSARKGRFEAADGGTIFLDEVGELPPSLQAKLLRVLQYGEFEPVGATVSRRIDVRVIAATKVDLEAAIAAGRFRQDLYFRLNVTPIRVPPLREHDDDIPALIDYMVGRFNQRFRSRYITGVAPEAVEALVAYDFPGNVRELENAIEHGFVRCRGRQIRLEHLPAHIVEHRARLSAAVPPPDSLEAMEREFLIRVLDENSWRLNAVADRLCLSRTTLWRRLRRLGIENRRRGSKSADSGEESEQRRRQRER